MHYSINLILLWGSNDTGLDRTEVSDAILITDGRELPIYNVVLASRSPVFRGMFTVPMKESQQNIVEIKAIEYETMENILKYLYTGEIPTIPNVNHAIKFLAVAEEYDTKQLKDFCEEIIKIKVTAYHVFKELQSFIK